MGLRAEVEILDAGETPETAARAARAAVEGGARMLVGPLFAEQARAVAALVPRDTPVVTLSNDDSLASEGLFVFGVTPLHSARAEFGYAARQGAREILVAVPPGPFGERSVEAAAAAAAAFGLSLRPPLTTGRPEDLRLAIGASAPDAVYLPSAGPELAGLAKVASEAGVLRLGSIQWSALDLAGRPELEGARFAAPDPLRFAAFSEALLDRGVAPGILTGLTFDGVELARVLGRLELQSRKGLLREKGFEGVMGAYRFLPSGQALRSLAVLGIGEGGRVDVLGTSIA